MEFDVVLERNPKTGVWVAEVPGMPGAYSQGKTRGKAVAHVRVALRLVIQTEGIWRPPTIEFANVADTAEAWARTHAYPPRSTLSSWVEFDPQDPGRTIPVQLETWARNMGIVGSSTNWV